MTDIHTTLDFSNVSINTPSFSLYGYNTYARVVDVYDGDTITVVFPFYEKMYKFSLRLYGIDTCELKSGDPLCREKAISARNELIGIIRGDQNARQYNSQKEIQAALAKDIFTVWVECLEYDKYGRVLARVIKHSQMVADVLIEKRLGYPYFGKTKLNDEAQKELLECD